MERERERDRERERKRKRKREGERSSRKRKKERDERDLGRAKKRGGGGEVWFKIYPLNGLQMTRALEPRSCLRGYHTCQNGEEFNAPDVK